MDLVTSKNPWRRLVVFRDFKNINPLLLIPAPFLASDFLPEWFLYSSSLQLIILTFFRVHKFLGYINFYFIWLIFETVGRQIIPETMIPSLATLLLAQMFYNKWVERNETFLFFLWVGIFSVFSASFNYLIYSIIILIYFFLQQSSDKSFSLSAILKTLWEQKVQMLFTALVSSLLFVFFPRFHGFLPSANYKTKGEVGYSQKVDNSNTANLTLSSQVAFYAELPSRFNQETLYWRGRVHNRTDGYNWSSVRLSPNPGQYSKHNETIKVKMKFEQDFGGDIMILDHPYKVTSSNSRFYRVNPTNEFKFYRKKKKVSLMSESIPKSSVEKTQPPKDLQYVQLPQFLPKELKEFVDSIDSKDPRNIIKEFANYVTQNGFSYTLKPGYLPTLKTFLDKKQGYCTHFASFLGLVLRKKGIPTQLVSGFQGGDYNEFGKFYVVKSNDAHTWVEYFDKGRWNRVDPTGFVSPARIQLGGTNFLNEKSIRNKRNKRSRNFLLNYYNTFKLQLDNINYKVSLFFDNYDRDKQKDISQFLKVKRQTFYLFGIVLIGLFIGIYIFLTRNKVKIIFHPVDKELIKLDKKLKLKQKLIEQSTIQDMKIIIQSSEMSEHKKAEVLELLKEYQIERYSLNKKHTNFSKKVNLFKYKAG